MKTKLVLVLFFGAFVVKCAPFIPVKHKKGSLETLVTIRKNEMEAADKKNGSKLSLMEALSAIEDLLPLWKLAEDTKKTENGIQFKTRHSPIRLFTSKLGHKKKSVNQQQPVASLSTGTASTTAKISTFNATKSLSLNSETELQSTSNSLSSDSNDNSTGSFSMNNTIIISNSTSSDSSNNTTMPFLMYNMILTTSHSLSSSSIYVPPGINYHYHFHYDMGSDVKLAPKPGLFFLEAQNASNTTEVTNNVTEIFPGSRASETKIMGNVTKGNVSDTAKEVTESPFRSTASVTPNESKRKNSGTTANLTQQENPKSTKVIPISLLATGRTTKNGREKSSFGTNKSPLVNENTVISKPRK